MGAEPHSGTSKARALMTASNGKSGKSRASSAPQAQGCESDARKSGVHSVRHNRAGAVCVPSGASVGHSARAPKQRDGVDDRPLLTTMSNPHAPAAEDEKRHAVARSIEVETAEEPDKRNQGHG